MNSELRALYASKWDKLTKHMQHIKDAEDCPIKPTNPLLLSIDEEEYRNADIRIMFYGQETNSWYDSFNPNMQFTLKEYENFYLSGTAMKGYGGHFWNGINRFKKLFQKKYPDKKLAFVWNNIIKIGNEARNANRPPAYTYKVEREYFSVIKEEIEILRPDVLLFLTGPNYDSILKDNFGNVEKSTVPGFKQRALVQVMKHSNTNAFRTYHPRYLWMNDIDKHFNAIINSIQLSQQPTVSKTAEEVLN